MAAPSGSRLTLGSAPADVPTLSVAVVAPPAQQRMPRRTTKTNQKLKLFPENADSAAGPALDAPSSSSAAETAVDELATADAAVGLSHHHHVHHVHPHPLLPRGQARETFLRGIEKNSLPRATAYCTANSYNMELLMEYLLSRKALNGTSPRRYDEALYTPYTVNVSRDAAFNDLLDL
ncbi:hypothetical protein HK405_001248, partial [Cladochytrium tenue]